MCDERLTIPSEATSKRDADAGDHDAALAHAGPLKPLKLIEDEPADGHETDQLQLASVSRLVAEAALGTEGPFTIGVFGPWGAGKTSVLRQAKSWLETTDASSEGSLVTVWFWFVPGQVRVTTETSKHSDMLEYLTF